MNTLLIYIIKASIYLGAFYLVYSILLSKDTLYRRNRTFILLSVLAALALPFVTIYTSKPVNISFFGKTLSEVFITGNSSGVHGTISSTDWNDISIYLTIYVAGVIVFGCKLLFDLLELIILIADKKEMGSNIIRFQGLNTSGFSALGYVFINTRLSSEEAEEIIKHEQNHIDHYHFLDIIFIETVKVIQWFNPFIHLFNRSLRAVHEYQADERCLRRGIPVVSYQSLIMNQVFRSKAFTITNSFSNPTLIKKRMIMMTKKRSGMKANLKLLMVLPVIAIVLIAFSSCKGKTNSAKSTTVEVAPPPPPPPVPAVDISDQKVPVGYVPKQGELAPPPPPPPPVPYEVMNGDTIWHQVDQMPIFKGGDAALSDFVGKNTHYPEAAVKTNTQGRVFVAFIVDEKGKVGNAHIINKSVSPELDAEALRVVNSLPDFEKPGINKGKPVPVWFVIPINFSLK
jgi:TonB family protein